VLRYDDLEVRIVPKVPVARLLHLASFRNDPDVWRPLEALLDDVDDPLSAVAHALVFHAEQAMRPTPLQGYVTHEEPGRRVRGRILFDRQLSARAGVPLPVELRFDEYELGIAENRVLLSALSVVARFVTDVALRRRIRHLRAQLDGVAPWPVGMAVPEFVFNRLNLRYKPALSVAQLVLERRSLEYPQARRAGTSFLLNMNAVFESYLEAALGSALERMGGRAQGQHKTTLDLDETLTMRPDLTWWRGGRCAAVIDAKYKRTTSTEFPNADAYQMLAYCTRLGLSTGFLVYADLDGGKPGATVVRNARIEIVVTAIDIGGSLDDLGASVDQLAATIAASDSARGRADSAAFGAELRSS